MLADNEVKIPKNLDPSKVVLYRLKTLQCLGFFFGCSFLFATPYKGTRRILAFDVKLPNLHL